MYFDGNSLIKFMMIKNIMV